MGRTTWRIEMHLWTRVSCAANASTHTHGGVDAHTHAWDATHTRAYALRAPYIGRHPPCLLPHFHSTGAVHPFSLLVALRLPSSNSASIHVDLASNSRYKRRGWISSQSPRQCDTIPSRSEQVRACMGSRVRRLRSTLLCSDLLESVLLKHRG